MKPERPNLWKDITDQTLSTLLVAFLCFSSFKGLMALYENPPDPMMVVVILGVGVFLGIMKFTQTDKQPPI
jgi:hypothetical protein